MESFTWKTNTKSFFLILRKENSIQDTRNKRKKNSNMKSKHSLIFFSDLYLLWGVSVIYKWLDILNWKINQTQKAFRISQNLTKNSISLVRRSSDISSWFAPFVIFLSWQDFALNVDLKLPATVRYNEHISLIHTHLQTSNSMFFLELRTLHREIFQFAPKQSRLIKLTHHPPSSSSTRQFLL